MKKEESNVETEINKEQTKSIKSWKITKTDKILMAVITFIYAIISFINLGTFKNPQTFWESKNVGTELEYVMDSEGNTYARYKYVGDELVIKIADGTKQVSNIRYYVGANFGNYDMSFSYDGENYSEPLNLKTDKVFAWNDFGLSGDFQYVKLVPKSERIYIGEIAIYDIKNNKLDLEAITENAKLLIDEQDTVPEVISYLNSTYFDEIYFARTAYEHLHDLPVYENTHPPLGKLIMAIPVIFMGMTTFAYRLMGNLAGICMIPAMYVLAKMLFKDTKWGVLAAIIMAADGMHFVQSRLGTADGFLVLFVILEYLFMYRYILQKDEPFKKRKWNLFWSGLFMGMAIAVKWNGVFAAIGLAVIFILNLIKETAYENKKWTKENTLTIIVCIWFFVFVPIIIYIMAHIPLMTGNNVYIKDGNSFIKWQTNMYDYHHNLEATHPYESKWYTWPITQKSVLYWVGTTSDGAITRIALLGNPIIWWFSIPTMIFTLVYAIWNSIKKKDFKLWFLVIPIIAMMAAYVGVPRIMFLYHYFPILPFVMLTIVAFIKWVCDKVKNDYLIYIFVAIIVIVFMLFYPIYSGYPTSLKYIHDLQWGEKIPMLKWLGLRWIW